jgi:rubrerythrin
MRTSKDWWLKVSASEPALIAWLKKQYHGEATAAERIERYCKSRVAKNEDERMQILTRIANDERTHAGWVGDLLRARGETPTILFKKERYWDETLADIDSFVKAAAVAHHAEMMRLERIEVIAHDETAPADVREVFAKILVDERFHAKAFGLMAGTEAIEEARSAHQRGAKAIGFVTRAEAV